MPWRSFTWTELPLYSYSFTNLSSNPLIMKVILKHYNFFGEYCDAIIVEIYDRTRFPRLIEQAKLRGIYPKEGHILNNFLEIQYRGIVPIVSVRALFDAVQAVEPSFLEIRGQLNAKLGIDSPDAPPSWSPRTTDLTLPPPHLQPIRNLTIDETQFRNQLQTSAEEARNDIIREKNIAENRCNICLTNPAIWMCNEYSMMGSVQPTLRTRTYVCNYCESTVRTQRIGHGIPKYQNFWKPKHS